MNLIVGTILPIGYSVKSSVPDGFLACDGSAVNRTTYSDLYSAIGDAWGQGDGATTFNLPDLRGLFLRGVDDGTGKDPDAGSRSGIAAGGATGDHVGSLQQCATALPTSKNVGTSGPAGDGIDANGNHTHSVPHLPTDKSWYYIAGSHYAAWNSGSPNSSSNGNHTHTVSSGGDVETRPINLYVDFMVYVGATPSND